LWTKKCTSETAKQKTPTYYGILVYRDFLKYLITIQEFTICLNISIIHLKEKLKFIQKPFIKINGMLKEINF
jgi:hypothetical protein